MLISVVIPVYGCRKALPDLCRRTSSTIKEMGFDYEIILVDDHCPQDSWTEIQNQCSLDDNVIGIRLSRNFGQIRAITAGLEVCRGEWVVVMDCDLQDRPEAIPELYAKAQEGYDVVFARRIERKDTGLTKLMSKTFYKVYEYFTDGNYDASLCNFSISRRIVIDNYLRMREHNRGYTMFIKWLGFREASVEVVGDERFEGKSSYNFSRKMHMAFELITAQSNKPLRFAINIGFIIALFAFIYLIYLVISHLIGGNTLAGWTSTIASIYLIGGLILAAIGVVGIYIGNIFTEVKDRPLFVVAEVLNGKEDR